MIHCPCPSRQEALSPFFFPFPLPLFLPHTPQALPKPHNQRLHKRDHHPAKRAPSTEAPSPPAFPSLSLSLSLSSGNFKHLFFNSSTKPNQSPTFDLQGQAFARLGVCGPSHPPTGVASHPIATMAPSTSIKDAIKAFEAKKGVKASEVDKVELYGMDPPIVKLDSALSTLSKCKHLALSTNNIAAISNLSGLDSLKILSLGRNNIKKIEGLSGVVDTLEELWMSYNLVEKLTGLSEAKKLKVLYMSNNKIASWSELDALKECPSLEEVIFTGNPFADEYKEDKAGYRIAMLKVLPNLTRIDGTPVDVDEREAAQE